MDVLLTGPGAEICALQEDAGCLPAHTGADPAEHARNAHRSGGAAESSGRSAVSFPAQLRRGSRTGCPAGHFFTTTRVAIDPVGIKGTERLVPVPS
ncbi:MAG: hypothetical protein MZV63_06285 [Marinilabiliales bacterium]|nr:hypothetical protein [Marinilabiliales bacterium]